MTCCARNGLRGRHGASGMIEMRRTQLGFGDGLIAAEVSDLREGWMKHAEMVLRLLILKHIRNWSYEVLEREVRANLVYRDFTRVGAGKAPDAKTMGRWGLALGPEGVEKIHERVVEIAQEKQVVKGRKMRLDTTVVETNIHYPTDSNLLGDGVRVLIRAMKRIGEI